MESLFSNKSVVKTLFRWVMIALMMVALSGLFPAQAAARTNPQSNIQNTLLSPWTLQWRDEFNATTRTGINTNKWRYDVGTQYLWPNCPLNWGTGEMEKMTKSLSNVYQNGLGRLAIRPTRKLDGTWFSGRIETKRSNFQPPTGGAMAVEAKIKLPLVSGAQAQGYWPAFWMLGAPFRVNQDCTLWPSVGEIDIMENRNEENTVYATLHCDIAPGGACNEYTGKGSTAAIDRSKFHIYRVELDTSVSPQEIRWCIDAGVAGCTNAAYFFKITEDQFSNYPNIWDNATKHGFFIILDVAMGGAFPGAPTPDTKPGAAMVVDYVRVYYANGTP